MDAVKTGETQAELRPLSQRERLIAGLKVMGMCWGIAILTVFVPVLHFVLVPGFLIGGIVGFFIRFRLTELMESTQAKCPECGQTFEIKNFSFNWPLRKNCPKCEMVLLFDRASEQ